MILVGNQRAGGFNLASHLLKSENERVEIHELRGFVSTTLAGAFQESYAISRATKCKQHLYSLSLNPPKDADVETGAFEKAIEQIEERLGLTGQPRAIVFHKKRGSDGILRRHAHAVWCRIDRQVMKAIHLSKDRQKLQEIARGLYIQYGWKMPLGFVNTQWRDPRNFSLEEWQQAKRAGKDPKKLKALFQERWAISDTKASFARALEEQGFILAKGDRRGFVAVDHEGEAYAIARWVGVKTKQVRERLGKPDDLPSVAQAHQQAAQTITARLEELRHEQAQKTRTLRQKSVRRREAEQARQKLERERLQQQQVERQKVEQEQRQTRVRNGLLGLLDRLTGRRKRMLERNQTEARTALLRDQAERTALRASQAKTLNALRKQTTNKTWPHTSAQSELEKDIHWLENQFKTALKPENTKTRSSPRKRPPALHDREPEP